MTVTPVAADAERLQRRLRWPALSRSAEPDVRVALLSTFTVDPLVPYLGTELAGEGIRADLWVAPFNQIERQCLEAESATAQFAPHIAVCVPRLEELWSGKDLPLAADPAGYGEDLRYLAQACVDAASRWDADLVFVLPPVPETRPAGVGDDGNDSGVLAAASAARESVRGLLAGRSRVHVVDAEAVLRTLGSRGAYRPDPVFRGVLRSARQADQPPDRLAPPRRRDAPRPGRRRPGRGPRHGRTATAGGRRR